MSRIDQIQNVAVLGAGTMGAGIAQLAAQHGYATCLYDIHEDFVAKGRSRIVAMLDKGVEKGKSTAQDRQQALDRIRISTVLGEAVEAADVVIEAAPEDLALKQQIFGEVAAAVSETCLLATNTSSLAVTRIAEAVPSPQRFLGMHFFNPPPLMKLCEIVRGDESSEESVALAAELALALGKDPIIVKDSPGFASSRLGLVLGLEAIRMLEEGVASAQDIDKAMELGYRHPMGPLKLTDLVGLDVRLAIASYLAETLDDRRFCPPALLKSLVDQGKTGKKSGEGFYVWNDGQPLPK